MNEKQPYSFENTISGAQVRAARGMLDWTAADLSRASGVGVTTIQRIERGQVLTSHTTTTRALLDAFARNGVTIDATDLTLIVTLKRAADRSDLV